MPNLLARLLNKENGDTTLQGSWAQPGAWHQHLTPHTVQLLQAVTESVTSKSHMCSFRNGEANARYDDNASGGRISYLLRYLVIGDIVSHRLFPNETLTARLWYSLQHQLPPLLFVHLWKKHTYMAYPYITSITNVR